MSNERESSASSVDAIALQQNDARLRMMIDAVPAMITYLDTTERYLFCNQPYLDLLGKTQHEVIGRQMKDILGEPLHQSLEAPRALVLSGQVARYERQHRRPDGSIADLAVTFVPHFDAEQRLSGFVSLTLDITERKTLERKLAHLAQHDTLTGLPNRALYDDRLDRALERHKRLQVPFALAYLDVDHFKHVNDSHGHAVGDALLRAVALRLTDCLRGIDTAARLGGDEFAVILEGPITPEHAARVGQKIVAALAMPFVCAGVTLSVTASVGIALAAEPALSAATLAARADGALYQVKARGRNGYAVSD